MFLAPIKRPYSFGKVGNGRNGVSHSALLYLGAIFMSAFSAKRALGAKNNSLFICHNTIWVIYMFRI
jgi:hypothetical protein